jgi:CheY-like chemotaxis protein
MSTLSTPHSPAAGRQAEGSGKRPSAPLVTANPSGLTVLLIDDDETSRHFVTACLESAGFRMLTAKNGREGLGLAGSAEVAAIVTDIFMPDGDGIEVVRTLRTLRPEVPVVAISGGSALFDQDYLKCAAVLGASATLAKPFRASKLISLIHDILKPKSCAPSAYDLCEDAV